MNKGIEDVLKLRSWVHIAHHIPGRIRLKYQAGMLMQLAGLNAKNIESALGQFPALTSYQVTQSTGSILISYDANLIRPADIEGLFSKDDSVVQQACAQLKKRLNQF